MNLDAKAIRRIRRRELLGTVAIVAAWIGVVVGFCGLIWWSFDL